MTDPRTVIRDKVAMAMFDSRSDSEKWPDLSTPRKNAYRNMADAAISAHLEALEQAARIESVEQLDALPVGAIVRSGGIAYYRHDRIDWYASNDEPYGIPSHHLDLPASVLYRPKETP